MPSCWNLLFMGGRGRFAWGCRVWGWLVLGVFPALGGEVVAVDDYSGSGGFVYFMEGAWGRDSVLSCWTGGTAGVSGPEHSYASCDWAGLMPGWTLDPARSNVWCGWLDLNQGSVSGWGASSYACGLVLAANGVDLNDAGTCGYAVGFRNSDDRLTVFRFSGGIVSGSSELPGLSESVVAGYMYSAVHKGVGFLVEHLPDRRWKLCWKAGVAPAGPEALNRAFYTDGEVTSDVADGLYGGPDYRYGGWVYAHASAAGAKAFFDNLGAGLLVRDQDSRVERVSGPAGCVAISSLATQAESAVEVMRVRLVDSGVSDGVGTVVTQLMFKPGPANGAGWAGVLGGVVLSNVTAGVRVVAGSAVVSDAGLVVPVAAGALAVPDGGAVELALSVYLSGTGLVDNSCLAWRVAADGHGFVADGGLGSGFAASFGADLVGNVCTVRVAATRLLFAALPGGRVFAHSNFTATVWAVDDRGNRDLDCRERVTLRLVAGSGQLASGAGLSCLFEAGGAEWRDLRMVGSASDRVMLEAVAPGLVACRSDGIEVEESDREVVALFKFDGDSVRPAGGHRHVDLTNFGTDGSGATAFPAGVAGLPDKAFRKTQWSRTDLTNQYFAFSVSVDPGFLLTLTGLEFDEQRSDSGPTNWTVWYSAASGVFHEVDGGNCSGGSWGATDVADDLLPFMATGSVQLRIFGTNAGSASGTWRLDNVKLLGRTEVDRGYRVIRFQGFEVADGMDNWSYEGQAGGGAVGPDTGCSYRGRRSLALVGSEQGDSDPCVTFGNVDLAGWSDVRLGLAFAAMGPDAGDDLWLEFSYDNGASWSGSNRLVCGGGVVALEFGATRGAAPVTVGSNPYEVGLPAGCGQVRVRVRFDEAAGVDNRGDVYRIDSVLLTGLATPQPQAPAVNLAEVRSGSEPGTALPMSHVTGGYPYPDLYLCWGVTDGGTNLAGWDAVARFEAAMWGVTLTNLENQAARMFYRAFVSNSQGCAWSDKTCVRSVVQRRPDGWYLVCAPAGAGRPWRNNLNSVLGEQLAEGLAGGGCGPGDSDALYVLGGEAWSIFYLDANRVWRSADDDLPADLELAAGSGCWIKRHGGAGVSEAGLFMEVGTNSMPVPLVTNRWRVLGWPYVTARHESDGADDLRRGWGFGAAGGLGSYTERRADRLLAFDGAGWHAGYLGEDWRWYVGGKPQVEANRLNLSFEPGCAYYYFRQGTSMVWTASQE